MKEKLLFEMFKDTVETGTEEKRAVLQKKYPDVNISNLHIEIVKYQVKKYGNSLNNYRRSEDDYKIKVIRAKNRKRRRINGR